MVQTFLLFETLTNEKTEIHARDIITSTITWNLGRVGSNNFGENTSFSPFTLQLHTAHSLYIYALPATATCFDVRCNPI